MMRGDIDHCMRIGGGLGRNQAGYVQQIVHEADQLIGFARHHVIDACGVGCIDGAQQFQTRVDGRERVALAAKQSTTSATSRWRSVIATSSWTRNKFEKMIAAQYHDGHTDHSSCSFTFQRIPQALRQCLRPVIVCYARLAAALSPP